MIWTILIFIVVLGVLVFVHEFGHFIAAKKRGMKDEEFGFGFPPRAFGIKRGETTYSINWIPLGGFVKIKGESGSDRQDPDSFASKPAWKRFIVLIAGVAMNLVLAAVLLSIGFMSGLPSVIDETTPKSAQVRNDAIEVMRVLPHSPADEAGLRPGVKIAAIDGKLFDSAEAARADIAAHGVEPIQLTLLLPDGSYTQRTLTPRALEGTTVTGLGIGLMRTGVVSFSPPAAIYYGVMATGGYTVAVVQGFYDLLRNLILEGKVSADVSGPVGIAVMTGEAARLGFAHLLQFAAILSINLAVINVLPFPALDGGRILFLIIEKVRRRANSEFIEGWAHTLGFALLMIVVVLVTYRDLVHYGGRMIEALRHLVGA